MRVVCVIPARVGSVRLPAKPLQLLGGEPLISVVAKRALALGFADEVIVASDDERVLRAVSGAPEILGVLTSDAPRNGTERVAEVAERPGFAADVIVNLQGDEPFVPATAVEGVLGQLAIGEQLATAAGPLRLGDGDDPSVVKVQIHDGRAMTFSRSVPATARWWEGDGGWARHIGIYGYRPGALRRWIEAPESRAERSARLEQLRPLANGQRMGVATVSDSVPPGIDTPEDLIRAVRYLETSMESVGA